MWQDPVTSDTHDAVSGAGVAMRWRNNVMSCVRPRRNWVAAWVICPSRQEFFRLLQSTQPAVTAEGVEAAVAGVAAVAVVTAVTAPPAPPAPPLFPFYAESTKN